MSLEGPYGQAAFVSSLFSSVLVVAGGITLTTQLIIQCPNTRLQALLATSSQLFLNVPLVLITVHIVLYGKRDDAQVEEFRGYRPFILAQLVVAAVEMAIAFTLMSVAIYVADTSRNSVGIWGICLTGVSVVVAALTTLYPLRGRGRAKIWDMAPQEKVNLERYLAGDDGKEKVTRYELYRLQARRFALFCGAILFQLVFAAIVVGFGAHAAATAPIQFGCSSA